MNLSPYSQPADGHLHTRWCGHATGEMREYVEAARAQGLVEIGFSVHMPVRIPIAEKLCLDADEMPLYVAEFRRLRAEYAGRIEMRMAGECDILPGQEDEIRAAIAAWPFDYIIGSVHFIDGWSHDNPAELARWETVDVEAIYRRYYELLAGGARSGLYDIVGHFDLVKKFGFRPQEDVADAEEAAVDAVAEAGMAIEINTAGWDKPVGEQYPSERILRMLEARGVPVCFGSDAHAPEEVGRHFDRAVALARSVGWTRAARFEGRRRNLVPI